MKSKPVVMEHFSTVHTSYILNFDFTNNITILTGSSATGKTASFSFMRECMAVNPNIMCINYQDYYKNIKKMISEETGKLIVIDNADILLDDDTRKYISMDHKNQYLIIGRNPKNLFTTSDNLFELVSEKRGEHTEFRLKNIYKMAGCMQSFKVSAKCRYVRTPDCLIVQKHRYNNSKNFFNCPTVL